MMSLSTTSAFDCEKHCKVHAACFFFKFSEEGGVCELFESEYRTGCSQVAGALVRNYDISFNIRVQTKQFKYRVQSSDVFSNFNF